MLLMALAQASEDARSLHGFKRNQINPQKKNPLRDVEHKDAVFGPENIAAHRVLKTRGHYCMLVLIYTLPQLLLATAGQGCVTKRSSWMGPTMIAMCLCLLPLCYTLDTASAEVSGAAASAGDRGRIYIPSSMLSLVCLTLIAGLWADFLPGHLWQVQPSSES